MADDDKRGDDKSRDDATSGKNPDTPKPKELAEIGVIRNMPFASKFENAWEILKTDDITVAKLISMRNTDGQARALFGLITLPIRASLKGATYQTEEGVTGGEEEAQFIEDLFTQPPSAGGMRTPFPKFIAQMLLAVFDGFSAFEMVYQTAKTGPWKGKWTLDKLAYRAPETLTFLVDDHGDYAGLRQRVNFKGEYKDVKLPKEHTFYYAVNEEENPFYGRSMFNAAFYHWDKKVKIEYIMHLAGQRAAVGTRVGKAGPNASKEERMDFKRALANLGVAQHILLPRDYEVTSLSEGGNFDFLGLVNYHNSQMSKSVLAAFFDQNQGGGANDGALVDFGKQSDALFLLMLQTIMDDIASVINTQIIPRFIDWNFGSGKYPTFRWGELTPDQKTAIRDTFDKLAPNNTTPEFMLALEEKYAVDTLGLEIDYPTIKEDRLEQKQQDKLMQDAQMQQGMMGAALGGDPMTSQSLPDAQAGGAALPGDGSAPPPTPDQAAAAGDPAAAAPAPDQGAGLDALATPQGPGGAVDPENDQPDTNSTLALGSIPTSYLPEGFDLTGGTGDPAPAAPEEEPQS